MHSKNGLLVAAVVALLLSACAEKQNPETDHSEDNIIGQNLSSVSSIVSQTGSDNAKIAMYDPVVCRIHQFDMGSGKYERTLTPAVTGGNHKVMFDPNGNYVIDVVDAKLSVFDQSGVRQDPNVTFAGAPKTASFRPQNGAVVMQDDSKTAVLMKINNAGLITGSVTLGQIMYGNVTMLAGDIDDFGNLIVATSDGRINVVDIQQTITNVASGGSWEIVSFFNSGLSKINWLAPMHDGSRRILVKTEEDSTNGTTMAILDVGTGAQVGASYVVPTSRKVIKTSKLYDPHFIVRDDVRTGAQSTIVYVSGGAINTKTITNPIRNILSSRLSVSGNSWAIVDTDIWKIWDVFSRKYYTRIVFDDYNIVQQNRLFQKYSLASMALLRRYVVPDTTQLQIGENKIFQLYPSKLGWAVNTSIANAADLKEITKFNYPFLHQEPCR